MTQNRLFPTTATLLPQLSVYRTKFVLNSKFDDSQAVLNTKITEAAVNYYWQQMQAEQENQRTIMASWLYGYAAVKQGYFTQYKKSYEPKKGILDLLGKTKNVVNQMMGKHNIEMEENPEYIEDEGPFLYYVSPRNLILDCSKPFNKGTIIHEKIPNKSLYDIKKSGLYQLPDAFYQRYSRGLNLRESSINLYETWLWEKDYIYLCVTCDLWEKPLRSEKIPYMSEGLPYRCLTFNKQVDVTYPVSHMKVAQRQQTLNDYNLNLQRESIEKFKDITLWNGDAFDSKESLNANNSLGNCPLIICIAAPDGENPVLVNTFVPILFALIFSLSLESKASPFHKVISLNFSIDSL